MIKKSLFLIFFLMSVVCAETIKPEKELAGVRLGLSKPDVINCLGEPQSETLIVAPGTGIVYDFMDYRYTGILVILKDSAVSSVSIFSPCKSKTAGGLAIGDNLSVAKKLYGKSIKQSLGYASKFFFPEYNLTVKGLKGTVIITEITIGSYYIR
ncbi:MAG: hypothetical protein ABRQ39_14620 [Candidatus Eremiobacterota bacterium]